MRRRLRSGFTLLELVIVLVILATIAGLVIPQLSMLGRTSDMAASAKTQQDVANQLGLYFVLQKRFPTRCDSLLEGAGGATAPTGVLVNATRTGATTGVTSENQGWGLPLGGSLGTNVGAHLVMVDLNALATPVGVAANTARSFTRAGFLQLTDHAPWSATGDANSSGVNLRDPLTTSAGGCFVARVASLTNGDTMPGGTSIVSRLYPGRVGAQANTLPDGVTCIVAVGVGPNSSLVPDTMLNAPSYPGCDGSYYGRYIAYFACFADGSRAQLVGVSDAYGRFPNYTQQQFNETLPNNGRQG